MARRLVQPLTYGGVPAQQPCPLHYLTASVPTQHWMHFSHGLWTPTEPLQSRDGQRVYRKDENGNRRSEVYDLQGTGQHKKILRPSKNSSSGVPTGRQGLPQRIGYLHYVPLTKTLVPTAWPFCSRTADRTYGLLLKAATLDEVTPSSIQRSKAPRHIWHAEFDNIFHSESIALRRSNLEGGVNVRGHLHFYPWTAWQHSGAILACLLVILKHTSLAPILLTLTLRDVYNVKNSSRSLILISEDSPGGELYYNHNL